MSQRSILALTYTLDMLESKGIDCDQVLARHGLNRHHLDPNSGISRDRELLILTELLPKLDEPTLALNMGNSLGLAGYGPLTLLLMTSRSAFEGFQFGIRYQSLTYLYAELSMVPGPQYSALRFTPITLPPQIRDTLIERDVVGTFKLVNDIQNQLGLSLGPSEVQLPYPRPVHAAALEDYFRCPVTFDQPLCQALISNDVLATRMPGFNQTAQDLYRNQCDALLQQRQPVGEHLSDRVLDYLQLFAQQFPTAAQVAEAFGIPERSLRRQLGKEQAPFQGLLDRVRADKARRYLQDSNYSIEQVAGLLGYSEAAAFIRAFERWQGSTPARYRAGQRGKQTE